MTEHQMNGPTEGQKYIDSIDPEDPEYIRQMRRPAEIKEDVKQMEQRKRVSLIMNSRAFREELEQIVAEQIRAGTQPTTALQQISEMILPQSRFANTSLFSKSQGQVIPIADIRGVDSLNYGKGEKMLRCKLAACYRLVDLFGWSQGITNHITARISQDHEHFLVNPYGVTYHEITAAGLAKVDMRGEVLDGGSTGLNVDKDGFTLHAAIHAARPDIKALLHIRNSSSVAVSVMKCGLLPLCQEALIAGEFSHYDDFTGAVEDQEERDKIARSLGPINKVLFLRNYGFVAGGESVEEAFLNAYNIMTACDVQVRAMPVGLDNLTLPSEESQKKIAEMANQEIVRGDGENKRKWRKGEIEFEALMRHLDNAGYRTGYIYHEPLVKREGRKERANSEVEVPPTVSSFSYMWDEDKLTSPLKEHMERHKKQFKSEWLATPNVYRREEIEERGTPTPKKITKWVSEESPNVSNAPIRIETPNQFAPQGENPKELRQKHREIRSDYYTEKISAGPQSRILEGMTWEEAQRIKDGHVSGTTDSVIVMGAASKGIIKRGDQHNVAAYKAHYAANPFDNMTEEEIERYKREIAHGKGEGDDAIVPGPDGKLISTEERMHYVRRGDTSPQHSPSHGQVQQHARMRPGVQETSIDDVPDSTRVAKAPARAQTLPATRPSEPESPPGTGQFQRIHSARYAHSSDLVQELQQNFERSKSERKPKRSAINGDEGAVPAGSPAKSSSSGDGTLDERSSREGSPTKEVAPEQGSPSKSDKKKKKKFRMPSFSKKKDKKEKEKEAK